ncbi:MAG: ATP-dependent DNA ligase, partial [Pseudomonadota bacterium]|nr:ATP-dependent DNA ligase [Pseudomonadota bacterium]
MTWPVPLDLEPMEAEPVAELPAERGWAFEPKYDGFRCIAFRDADTVDLRSRRQRPLARFFPEVAATLQALPVQCFVMDGELVIEGAEFDTLQLRLHPAASRIARLSREHPATFVAFDLLADAAGRSLLDEPFEIRRAALDALFERIGGQAGVRLSAETRSSADARRWLADIGHGLDGIVAKRLDLAYRPGRRAMLKYKVWHTIDCVVGGVYLKTGTPRIEYLLLGLYDEAGRLNYVGRCPPHRTNPDGTKLSGAEVDAAATEALVGLLLGRGGFTGHAPGGPSRWSAHEKKAIPAEPRLVVEVSADHVTAGKFRHGSRLLRWRDDKDPRRCAMKQLESFTSI